MSNAQEPSDDENDMLDLAFGLTRTSRLGCQVIADRSLDGIVVRLPAVRHRAGDARLLRECRPACLTGNRWMVCHTTGHEEFRGGQDQVMTIQLQVVQSFTGSPSGVRSRVRRATLARERRLLSLRRTILRPFPRRTTPNHVTAPATVVRLVTHPRRECRAWRRLFRLTSRRCWPA